MLLKKTCHNLGNPDTLFAKGERATVLKSPQKKRKAINGVNSCIVKKEKGGEKWHANLCSSEKRERSPQRVGESREEPRTSIGCPVDQILKKDYASKKKSAWSYARRVGSPREKKPRSS